MCAPDFAPLWDPRRAYVHFSHLVVSDNRFPARQAFCALLLYSFCKPQIPALGISAATTVANLVVIAVYRSSRLAHMHRRRTFRNLLRRAQEIDARAAATRQCFAVRARRALFAERRQPDGLEILHAVYGYCGLSKKRSGTRGSMPSLEIDVKDVLQVCLGTKGGLPRLAIPLTSPVSLFFRPWSTHVTTSCALLRAQKALSSVLQTFGLREKCTFCEHSY